jgi:hypothetical protein
MCWLNPLTSSHPFILLKGELLLLLLLLRCFVVAAAVGVAGLLRMCDWCRPPVLAAPRTPAGQFWPGDSSDPAVVVSGASSQLVPPHSSS